jgi:hypothetical protein
MKKSENLQELWRSGRGFEGAKRDQGQGLAGAWGRRGADQVKVGPGGLEVGLEFEGSAVTFDRRVDLTLICEHIPQTGVRRWILWAVGNRAFEQLSSSGEFPPPR